MRVCGRRVGREGGAAARTWASPNAAFAVAAAARKQQRRIEVEGKPGERVEHMLDCETHNRPGLRRDHIRRKLLLQADNGCCTIQRTVGKISDVRCLQSGKKIHT